MKNATASKFVDKIKQLVGKYNLTAEQEYLNEILVPESKKTESNLTGEFLFDLYNNFDLSGRTIGFDFLGRLNENSEYIFFAISDPFDIGIDKKTNEIIMYDSEFNQVHLKLAKEINEFIEIILLIFEYGLDGWVSEKQYTKDDRVSLLKKIKATVDSEYSTFYEQSYGN
jgi:hypothetical protein